MLHEYCIENYSEGILLDMMDVGTGVLISDLFTRPSDGVLGRRFLSACECLFSALSLQGSIIQLAS